MDIIGANPPSACIIAASALNLSGMSVFILLQI
jgi:hypothetical protein